jgi:hypothetical protein
MIKEEIKRIKKEKRFRRIFWISITLLFLIDTFITFLVAWNFPKEFPYIENNIFLSNGFKMWDLWAFPLICPFLFILNIICIGGACKFIDFLFKEHKLKFPALYSILAVYWMAYLPILFNNFKLFLEAIL